MTWHYWRCHPNGLLNASIDGGNVDYLDVVRDDVVDAAVVVLLEQSVA